MKCQLSTLLLIGRDGLQNFRRGRQCMYPIFPSESFPNHSGSLKTSDTLVAYIHQRHSAGFSWGADSSLPDHNSFEIRWFLHYSRLLVLLRVMTESFWFCFVLWLKFWFLLRVMTESFWFCFVLWLKVHKWGRVNHLIVKAKIYETNALPFLCSIAAHFN
jgi:hypothetical protein